MVKAVFLKFKGHTLPWSYTLSLFRSHSWSQRQLHWHRQIQNMPHYLWN